jgi:O-antigen ligase
MISRSRVFVAPVYLFSCLVIGGSAQGIWENMVLQLSGIGIIAWAAWERSTEPISAAAKLLLLLAVATIAAISLQLIPLSANFWTHLGPREWIGRSFHVLGVAIPPQPLSLTPAAGLNSLLGSIPPLAIICAMVRLKAHRPQWLILALIAGTLSGIVLGAMQVASPNPLDSPWYLYDETNWGRAVGLFANADHMATLLVVLIPFLAAMVAAARNSGLQQYSAIVAVAGGLGMVVMVGVALNGSLAGYGLVMPVAAASALIILPQTSRLRLWIVPAAALLLVSSVTALETTAIGSATLGAHATSAVDSRADILKTTLHATRDFMPFGSGLGSFPSIYALYEKPDQVSTVYVVHAHNDYVELALELGLVGVAMMLLFIAWWIASVWRTWRTAEVGPFARAATIASAAILVHSLVDFPLRTAAIAACFGMCLALMADWRGAPLKEKTEFRGTRHREFK